MGDIVRFQLDEYHNEIFNSLTHSILSQVEPSTIPIYEDSDLTDNVLRNYFIIQTRASIDTTGWLVQSKAYVENLAPHKKHILRLYTHLGDNVVVEYMRNPNTYATLPRVTAAMERMEDEKSILIGVQLLAAANQLRPSLFDARTGEITDVGNSQVADLFEPVYADFRRGNREVFERHLKTYIGELREIIQAAPRPSQQMTVFRGLKKDYLQEPAYQHGFTSTSFSTDIAKHYADAGQLQHDDPKYMYEIQILPDTPCVCVAPVSMYESEREILLDADVFAVPNETLYEKFFLNEKRFSHAFSYEHLATPNTSPTYLSRIVYISATEPPQEGGFSTAAKRYTKRSIKKSPSTLRKTRKKTLFRRSELPTYVRPDPLQVPAPIPASVRRAIQGLGLSRADRTLFSSAISRRRRTLQSKSSVRNRRKSGTLKIRRGTPFPK